MNKKNKILIEILLSFGPISMIYILGLILFIGAIIKSVQTLDLTPIITIEALFVFGGSMGLCGIYSLTKRITHPKNKLLMPNFMVVICVLSGLITIFYYSYKIADTISMLGWFFILIAPTLSTIHLILENRKI